MSIFALIYYLALRSHNAYNIFYLSAVDALIAIQAHFLKLSLGVIFGIHFSAAICIKCLNIKVTPFIYF